MVNEWKSTEHALAYLKIADGIPHRTDGEATLLKEVPNASTRILDLGSGDGRLLSLLLVHCASATGIALDFSPLMLERLREEFGSGERVRVVEHDLDRLLPEMGMFDVVASSFAIHHLTHDRKRELYTEIWTRLQPRATAAQFTQLAESGLNGRGLAGILGAPGNWEPHMHTPSLSFFRHFATLRVANWTGRSPYRIVDLVFIVLCATIANADNWVQIEAWARDRRDWLARFCQLPRDEQGHPVTPSHDTLERLFKRLDPRAFARCFARWTAVLAEKLGLKQLAIDGKTLCGSDDPANGMRPLHLVTAWSTENHLSLAQVAVEEKSNEITAIPLLLELLDIQGALVSIDAMGCQKEIAKKIVDGGGDYVLPVKGNQEGLLRDIQLTFAAAAALDFEGILYACGSA